VLASNGGQAELQAALMRLKEEEREREKDLLREQREREVRIRSNYGCSMQSLTLKTVLTILSVDSQHQHGHLLQWG